MIHLFTLNAWDCAARNVLKIQSREFYILETLRANVLNLLQKVFKVASVAELFAQNKNYQSFLLSYTSTSWEDRMTTSSSCINPFEGSQKHLRAVDIIL